MEGKLIEKIGLENGLTLELFERSRVMAGDRWLVSFAVRIEIEVKPEYFANEHAEDFSFEDIRAVVGEKATYHHEKTRNFVVEAEKDDVFRGLKERFLAASLGYLSSPDFPRRLILKEYQQASGQIIRWKGH